LEQTFTFWSPLAPRSAFAGVCELEPAHLRVYEDGRGVDRQYWKPDYSPSFKGDVGAAAEAVGDALERASALRMLRADVPVGCYLSGGLDSSLVAALACEVRRDECFHTFSLRFEDAEYDETHYQRRMVESLGSEHHEVLVGRRAIADCFPEVVRLAERPLLRTAPAPLFLLSKLVHDVGIKVVLTGEGADEMFAGYDLFREGAVRRFWGRRPDSELRPRLLERLYPYLVRSPVAQKAIGELGQARLCPRHTVAHDRRAEEVGGP
jgi:asparagine synthase (glutamine-hydrolysing)